MRLRLCKALDRALPVAFAGMVAGLVVAACTGCSGPVLSFQPKEAAAAPEPLVTGSIAKRPTRFGAALGDEDWRRAHGALATALDPQGNGRPVKWDNPETAMRGSVNPTGLPYVAGDEICRDFLATVVAGGQNKGEGGGRSRFLRGTGCKLSGGEWELKRLRSAKS